MWSCIALSLFHVTNSEEDLEWITNNIDIDEDTAYLDSESSASSRADSPSLLTNGGVNTVVEGPSTTTTALVKGLSSSSESDSKNLQVVSDLVSQALPPPQAPAIVSFDTPRKKKQTSRNYKLASKSKSKSVSKRMNRNSLLSLGDRLQSARENRQSLNSINITKSKSRRNVRGMQNDFSSISTKKQTKETLDDDEEAENRDTLAPELSEGDMERQMEHLKHQVRGKIYLLFSQSCTIMAEFFIFDYRYTSCINTCNSCIFML